MEHRHTLFDDLPDFEGREPVGTSLTLGGKADRLTRPFRIGDKLVLVVEVTVTGVNHTETKGGIVREHKLAVADAYELGGQRKQDLLETLHEEYESAMDDMKGRRRLPFDGDGEEEPTDTAAAAAGAGPEARADARDDWDEFDPTGDSDAADIEAPADAVEDAGDGEAPDDPEASLAEPVLAEVPCPTCNASGKIGRGRNRKVCPACLGRTTITGVATE